MDQSLADRLSASEKKIENLEQLLLGLARDIQAGETTGGPDKGTYHHHLITNRFPRGAAAIIDDLDRAQALRPPGRHGGPRGGGAGEKNAHD